MSIIQNRLNYIILTKKITHFVQGTLPECPSKGKTTVNRQDQDTTNNVKNWRECSKVCRNKETCKHWTWFSDGAVYQCITMSNYGSTETNHKAVSGDRDCLGIKHTSVLKPPQLSQRAM